MELDRDELRREATAIHHEHRAVMGAWRDVLHRVFDPEARRRVSPVQKAALVGVPTRRQFLRIGGLTVAGSAILVACSDDDDDAATTSTTGAAAGSSTTGAPETTPTTEAAATEQDLTLLRTAQSIEVLAIDAYQAAVDSGLVETAAIADAAVLFQEQHRDHAGAIEATTMSLGGEPYTEANPYLQENVVGPALEAVTDELAVVTLALDLEDVAAQTYALAGGVLSTPTLRQTIMSIGSVEARHAAVLRGVLDGAGVAQVPVPFMPTEGAAPEESFV